MGFLSTYGQYFVTVWRLVPRLFGSYTMNARNSANSDELKAEASFSYTGGLYSASGSAEFVDRQSTLQEILEIKADYRSMILVFVYFGLAHNIIMYLFVLVYMYTVSLYWQGSVLEITRAVGV